MATPETRAWDEVSKSEDQVDVGAGAFVTGSSKRNTFPTTIFSSQSATHTGIYLDPEILPLTSTLRIPAVIFQILDPET